MGKNLRPVNTRLLTVLFSAWFMGSFFIAVWLILNSQPHHAERLFWLALLALLLPPIIYLDLTKRYASMRPTYPYFFIELDLLMFYLLPGMVLITGIVVMPRQTVWAFGQTAPATVLQIRDVEAVDDDLGRFGGTCIDFSYQIGATEFDRENCSRRSSLEPQLRGEPYEVTYLRWAPQFGYINIPLMYQNLDTALAFLSLITIGWVVGTAVVSHFRFPYPLPPMPAKSATEIVQRFGLNHLLTAEDDINLWAAVLKSEFRSSGNKFFDESENRFGIAQIAPATKLHLQPIEGYCFQRKDEYYLQVVPCEPEEYQDADFDPEIAPIVPVRLLHIARIPKIDKRITRTLVLPRPSINKNRVPVYSGSSNKLGTGGSGTAWYWEKSGNGSWKNSYQIIERWSKE
ncbi:MAG: hypothetical protein AAF490_19595 [Chloroflexota bacterium]